MIVYSDLYVQHVDVTEKFRVEFHGILSILFNIPLIYNFFNLSLGVGVQEVLFQCSLVGLIGIRVGGGGVGDYNYYFFLFF